MGVCPGQGHAIEAELIDDNDRVGDSQTLQILLQQRPKFVSMQIVAFDKNVSAFPYEYIVRDVFQLEAQGDYIIESARQPSMLPGHRKVLSPELPDTIVANIE